MRVFLANGSSGQRALWLYVQRWDSDLRGLESFFWSWTQDVRMPFSQQYLNASHCNLVIKLNLYCGVMWIQEVTGEYTKVIVRDG